MLTAEQHAARRRGVAASEMGAVMGLNPWKGPIDVWRDKVDPLAPPANDELAPGLVGVRSDWGNRLEPSIRQWYADTLGVEVTVPGTLWHPTDALGVATPDGVVYLPGAVHPRNGLEIKVHTINLRHLYGEPGSDEVPPWELIQCAWNMYVSGLPFWHLAAFIDGVPALYRIERDAELEGLCVEARDRFWHRYVVPRVPPPPDGTDSYAAELLRRWPRELRASLVAAGAAELEAIRDLRNVRDQLWALERREAVLEQTIKVAIADNEGIAWTEGRRTERITWKRSRDSARTDWEAAARELGAAAGLLRGGAAAALDNAEREGFITRGIAKALREAMGLDGEPETTEDVIRRHTQDVPGSRRFCAPRSWSRERPTDVDIDRKEHRKP
jgi:putative phage-type endonuclease